MLRSGEKTIIAATRQTVTESMVLGIDSDGGNVVWQTPLAVPPVEVRTPRRIGRLIAVPHAPGGGVDADKHVNRDDRCVTLDLTPGGVPSVKMIRALDGSIVTTQRLPPIGRSRRWDWLFHDPMGLSTFVFSSRPGVVRMAISTASNVGGPYHWTPLTIEGDRIEVVGETSDHRQTFSWGSVWAIPGDRRLAADGRGITVDDWTGQTNATARSYAWSELLRSHARAKEWTQNRAGGGSPRGVIQWLARWEQRPIANIAFYDDQGGTFAAWWDVDLGQWLDPAEAIWQGDRVPQQLKFVVADGRSFAISQDGATCRVTPIEFDAFEKPRDAPESTVQWRIGDGPPDRWRLSNEPVAWMQNQSEITETAASILLGLVVGVLPTVYLRHLRQFSLGYLMFAPLILALMILAWTHLSAWTGTDIDRVWAVLFVTIMVSGLRATWRWIRRSSARAVIGFFLMGIMFAAVPMSVILWTQPGSSTTDLGTFAITMFSTLLMFAAFVSLIGESSAKFLSRLGRRPRSQRDGGAA